MQYSVADTTEREVSVNTRATMGAVRAKEDGESSSKRLQACYPHHRVGH